MINRYSRQERFSPIGETGQQLLSQARVLLIGAGALGCASAESLVRSGIGQLTIADRDYVEWSNLQRQQLFSEQDAVDRLPKAEAAAKRLRELNSNVQIHPVVADISIDEIDTLTRQADLIIDATDNFQTRLLINDIANKRSIPWIFGACVGSYGMTYTVIPGVTPCLQCLLPIVPVNGATCETAGIIPAAVQMVNAYQSAEALKLLTGNSDARRPTLVSFDLWRNDYSAIDVSRAKNSDCPSCGLHPSYPYLSAAQHDRTTVLCGRDTIQIRPAQKTNRNLSQLADTLTNINRATLVQNAYLLSFEIESYRMVVFADGRVFVHGTADPSAARSLYYRMFG